MKCTVRRININLTEREETSLDRITDEYMNRGIKTNQMESQMIRDAINFYASSFANSGKDSQGNNGQ